MSDTDDTDLLLLIPPDFFLVRSDLEDFDSESADFCFGHQEVKDAIVSDLITQVNDLESRICQIESLERTSTRCSTCNDSSFINQSIISLTESDVLRAHIKDHNRPNSVNKAQINDTLMVEPLISATNDIFEKENGIRELLGSSSVPLSAEANISVDSKDRTNNCERLSFEKCNTHPYKEHKTIPQQEGFSPESQHCREKQSQLLNEVDSFLLNKQLIYPDHSILSEDSNQKEGCVDKESINTRPAIFSVSVGNQLANPPEDLQSEVEDEDVTQSIALTEVYKLINEMEDTHNEMQKKLNSNGARFSHLSGQSQDNSNNRYFNNRGQMYSSKVLDLEDLTTKSPKTLFTKQTEDALEKFKNERSRTSNIENSDSFRPGRNPETNYSLSQYPSTNEENIHQRTLKQKPVSPSRVSGGSYNPLDIVRANLPGRKDDRNSQYSEGKDSPNKSAGFRRQLNFEKPLSPLRVSKSRTSLQMEQKTQNQIEHQDKIESEKLSFTSHHKTSTGRPIRSNQSLEDKFSLLTMQRASGTTNRESQNINYNLSYKPGSESLHQKISSNNLLSLSELWNKEPTFYSDDPNKLRQKLEEERYRRQHCEQQIQSLQLRVLEEQEKLAVAVRVDQEKDRAIMQITDSWKKLNDHWGELEEQRHSLAQQLQAERQSAKLKSDELSKKAERWEKEVSQALDLAAGYKEKSEATQKQMELLKSETNEKLQKADDCLQKVTEENKKLTEESHCLTEQLKSFQQRLNEEEDLLSKLKDELEKSRTRLSEFEAENSVLKEQKTSLTISIKEERNRISILEQKLNSLQEAFNEACKKEKTAQEEARMSQERVDVARTELRALYQGQLEAVVKEKLQEFQAQLEVAEAALKAELQGKEKQWAEKANEQCRQLHDKYKRNLLRVEELHKADVNSWKEKLLESERRRAEVEKKLQEEAEGRAGIAQRLHNVMETQWREALNIISNPMKALYEMPQEEHPGRLQQQHGQSPEKTQGFGDVRVSRSDSTASLGPGEESPFCRDGLVTYRTSQPGQDQLKKYIQMLLERGPGNSVPPQTSLLNDSPEHLAFVQRNNTTTNGNNDLFDKWIMDNEKKVTGQSDRENQSNKPPWR